jgi:SAM-dependent methyltransferase
MAGADNLSPDAFAGTALAYARFRPPYPRPMLDDLLTRSRSRGGALLDLACGPGRIALDLAPAFETVWAVDRDAEMIEVARREALRRRVAGVVWRIAEAESLDAPEGGFDLITIGEAFHRLDQARVCDLTLRWLKPDGGLATMGSPGMLAGEGPWQTVVAGVARKWMARAFPNGWAGARPGAEASAEGQTRVLERAGFEAVESHVFVEPRDWSFEEILGYLESTSVCSRRALGAHFAPFAEELRSELAAACGPGPFHEALEFGYTLARKPRAS